jgi:ankyrin repeat protein
MPTPLDRQLLDAASNGKDALMLSLIEQQANVNAVNQFHNTPLHLAAMNAHHQAIQVLINHQANVNAIGQSCDTALHYAAIYCERRSVELLVEHGADKTFTDVCHSCRTILIDGVDRPTPQLIDGMEWHVCCRV